MKIGLIAMSGVRVKTDELAALGVTLPGFVQRGEVIASLPSLGLMNVAALTPPQHEIKYIENHSLEGLAELPDFDLVAISSLTARINDAYNLAAHYRQRGTRVVIGGLHASTLPDEALERCDTVVTGGAEGAWPQLLNDAADGSLKRLYTGATDKVFSNSLYTMPRFSILSGRKYNRITIQTSRGCPRACSFCAASLLITRQFNQKPVEWVIAEIREAKKYIREPFFEFADDNTFLNQAWAKDLLRALIKEDIRYFTETDASVADDSELCDLLAQSGCVQLLIGFESPAAADLSGIDPADWKARKAPEIQRVIDRLQSRGVSVNGCFILGLDNHTTDVFPQLLEFVRRSGLAEVQYTVFTPFPGTMAYRQLLSQGRLLRDQFWDRCTLFDVNYIPRRMTVDELERGMRWLFSESYTRDSTAERKRRFVRQRANAIRSNK